MKVADLYIRVSTDEQADKGYSQRSQEELLRKYCDINNISVRKVMFEDHSAKTFIRPEWKAYLLELKKHKGKADLVLFLKWDRFSRNAGDAYQMINTLRKLGIEPQAIEQPLDLSIPENKMMLAFYLAAPEVENDRRALNVIHGMRRARKEGRYMGLAPIGYTNKTDEAGRKYIAINEPQAGILSWSFEEIAKGVYNTEQVFKMAREKGFTGTKSLFWFAIRNPVYCGKIFIPKYKDDESRFVKGQHEPLIPEDLYYQVQDVLDGRKRGQYKLKVASNATLPLRGFLICPTCGKVLTGSASKGHTKHYSYYHCFAGCKFRNRADAINQQFVYELKKYIPRPEMAELYKIVLQEAWHSQTAYLLDDRKQLLRQIKELENKLSYIRDLLSSKQIEPDDFREMKSDYSGKVEKLEAKLSGLAHNDINIKDLLDKGIDILLKLDYIYETADIEKKREVISSMFPEKLHFENSSLRTGRINEAVKYIYMIDSKLGGNKKGQNRNKSVLSSVVALAGLEFNINTSLTTITIAAGTTLTATGDLSISGAGGALLNSGNINVSGNILLTSTSTGGGGTTTISIVGTGNETMDGTAIIINQSRLPNININKVTGTLSLTGNISFSGNVTYTAGIVNAGTSICYIVNNLTMTGSFTLFDLTVSAAVNTTLTIAAGTTITTTTLDLENAANYVVINTGTIAVTGNIIDNNSSIIGGGTGTILINGTGAQAITSTGIVNQGKFPSVTINKTAGTITFPALITVVGNWTYTAGTLDVITNNSTIVFNGNLTIAGNHSLNNISFEGSNNYTFTTAPATTLTVLGSMAITGTFNTTFATGTIDLIGDLNLTNTATGGGGTTVIAFTGTGNQAIHSALLVNQSTLPAITINKPSGTLTFPALITVFGNWTYTTGLYDVSTNNATVEFAGNVNFTGSHTLNNVIFEATNNWTFVFNTGTVLTITGTLTTNGIKNIFFNTPVSGATAIQAQGNIIINNTSVTGGGTALILIDGSGSQAITGNATASEGLLPFIKIQKTSGTLTLNGIISVSRDWTWLSGTVASTTSSLIFGGNSLSINSAGMSFYNVTITTNTSTLTSSLTVLNNLSITGAAILSAGSNTINLSGNWTNWGSGGFTEATSTVNFNGNSLQTITTPAGENFANAIINNSGPGIRLANAVTVATSLTMTQGNIDLNSQTVTLGTSALVPGILTYTLGTMINTGTFTRWFAKSTIASGAVAGLFPMGTATSYRPFNVSVPTAPTTGGTIAVAYTDAATNTTTSFPDGTDVIMVRKDLNWGLTASGLGGGAYNLEISGTGYGTIGNVSDLRLTLAAGVTGLPGVNAGTITNPQVNRTGITEAALTNTFYLGSINSTSSPLPVTLIFFTAVQENSQVKIEWETAAEVNNDYFTIQRSRNSGSWEDIKKIAGSGNTSTDMKYAAYDPNPYSGLSFYRLKQTDFDGRSSYSAISQVNFDSEVTLRVYPNPTTDHIYIIGSGKMTISVVNINGQLVNVPIHLTGTQSDLNVAALPAGIYFLRIVQDGKATTKKIIKR